MSAYKKIIEKIKDVVYPVIAAVVILGGASVIYAAAWVSPGTNPPKGNVAPPVNVSSKAQTKAGPLGINGNFAVFGNTVLMGKLRIADGSESNGRVLTSDAQGNATWAPLPAKPVVPRTTTWVLNCAPGSSEITFGGLGFCGYTLNTSGTAPTYCRGSDELIRVQDTGQGRNHFIAKVPPNGCRAWEESKNYGGYGCQLTCKSSGYVAQ